MDLVLAALALDAERSEEPVSTCSMTDVSRACVPVVVAAPSPALRNIALMFFVPAATAFAAAAFFAAAALGLLGGLAVVEDDEVEAADDDEAEEEAAAE